MPNNKNWAETKIIIWDDFSSWYHRTCSPWPQASWLHQLALFSFSLPPLLDLLPCIIGLIVMRWNLVVLFIAYTVCPPDSLLTWGRQGILLICSTVLPLLAVSEGMVRPLAHAETRTTVWEGAHTHPHTHTPGQTVPVKWEFCTLSTLTAEAPST